MGKSIPVWDEKQQGCYGICISHKIYFELHKISSKHLTSFKRPNKTSKTITHKWNTFLAINSYYLFLYNTTPSYHSQACINIKTQQGNKQHSDHISYRMYRCTYEEVCYIAV